MLERLSTENKSIQLSADPECRSGLHALSPVE
jgi:hypothetical protein